MKGQQDTDIDDDLTWDIVDEEGSWQLWQIMRGIEWKHLPDQGGLLDQDESLMQDIATTSHVAALVENALKADGKIGIRVEHG